LSRYTFGGENSRYRITVGWDVPLCSFFAQVEDLTYESREAMINPEALIGDAPGERLLVWLGADEPIDTVAQLFIVLAGYGTIPEAIPGQSHLNKPTSMNKRAKKRETR
jgi:hypothetical protein